MMRTPFRPVIGPNSWRAVWMVAGALAFAIVFRTDVHVAAFGNVGAQSCAACHKAAFDQWHKGPHSRSLEVLDAAQRTDPKCLQCHALKTTTGALEPVSCESCHGGGEFYVHLNVKLDKELAKAGGLEDIGEPTCLKCHTGHSPSLKKFDYAQGLQRIRHWPEGRKVGEKKLDYTPVKPGGE